MGLDNGFIAYNLPKENIPPLVKPFYINEDYNYIELAYFRKCYNIRDRIIKILHMSTSEHERKLDIEDLPAIIRILCHFCDSANWDEDESIWTFDEIKDNIIKSLINLSWLYYYMEEHPEVTCKFYDSY